MKTLPLLRFPSGVGETDLNPDGCLGARDELLLQAGEIALSPGDLSLAVEVKEDVPFFGLGETSLLMGDLALVTGEPWPAGETDLGEPTLGEPGVGDLIPGDPDLGDPRPALLT